MEPPSNPETSAESRALAVRGFSVPMSEFSFTFMRSGGPGGQNVNKVSSKARLRWPVENNQTLPPAIRARFIEQNRNQVTEEGDFIITSQRYRDQPRNVADCLEKLQQLLERAATPPVRRKKTRPSLGAKRRRLADKRQNSERKQLRRGPSLGDL